VGAGIFERESVLVDPKHLPRRVGEAAWTYTCDPLAVKGMINLNFDKDDRLIGIEVLGAKSRLPRELLKQATDVSRTKESRPDLPVRPVEEERLEELEQLELAASPRPWTSWVEGRDALGGDSFIAARGEPDADIYVHIRVDSQDHPASAADADFIAAARNAIPDLIAEIRRLRGAPGTGEPQ
jgi:hypothetical protein